MNHQTNSVISGKEYGRRTILGGVALSLASAWGLAGCSSSSPQGTSNLDASRIMPPEGGPKTTPTEGIQFPPDYKGPKAYTPEPLVSEPVTLRVAVPQATLVGDWNTNAMTKWFEKRTGVKIEWIVLPAGTDGTTKVNTMISSNELPDMFLQNPLSKSAMYAYARQGIFLELKDIVAKYCPNTTYMLDTFGDQAKSLYAPDGGLYAMPQQTDCYHCRVGWGRVWVHKPTMDALGLKMPTTTAEFKQVLESARKQRPGIQAYTTYSDPTPGGPLRYDMMPQGAFGYYPGSEVATKLIAVRDGKLYSPQTEDTTRNGLKYLAELRQSGAIDPAHFAQSIEQLKKQVADGNAIMIAAVWPGDFTDPSDPKVEEWVALRPFDGPQGKATVAWNYYLGMSLTALITKACKTPELAAAWVDQMFELEATLASVFGIKGKSWDWSKEGAKGLTGEQSIYWGQFSEANQQDQSWAQNAPTFRSLDFRDGQEVQPNTVNLEKTLREVSESEYFPYAVPQDQTLPPLFLDDQQSAAIATQEVDVLSYVQQSLTEFMNGTRDPNSDSDWEAYQKGANDRGMNVLLETYQAAYDQFGKQ